jgi:hypothetical protein
MSLGLLTKDGVVVFLGIVASFFGLGVSYGAVMLTLKLFGY